MIKLLLVFISNVIGVYLNTCIYGKISILSQVDFSNILYSIGYIGALWMICNIMYVMRKMILTNVVADVHVKLQQKCLLHFLNSSYDNIQKNLNLYKNFASLLDSIKQLIFGVM